MQILTYGKDKSLEGPFHRITSLYSYFEEFEFLRQFSKKQNMISAEQTKPSNVLPFNTLSQNSNLLYSEDDSLKHS